MDQVQKSQDNGEVRHASFAIEAACHGLPGMLSSHQFDAVSAASPTLLGGFKAKRSPKSSNCPPPSRISESPKVPVHSARRALAFHEPPISPDKELVGWDPPGHDGVIEPLYP